MFIAFHHWVATRQRASNHGMLGEQHGYENRYLLVACLVPNTNPSVDVARETESDVVCGRDTHDQAGDRRVWVPSFVPLYAELPPVQGG